MKRVFTCLVAALAALWGVAPSLTAQTEPSDEVVEKSITVEATEVTNNSISVRWTEVEETDVYFITPDTGKDARESSVDGTHPSDMGYMAWARSIEKPILKILKKYGIK